MKIGYVILCRYNSSRLPGKILKSLKGLPPLQHTFNRINQFASKDQIVIATSVEESDNAICDYCEANQINYFRGSLDNVARRFLDVAEQNDFDYVVRINGDNIFIDLETVELMEKEAVTAQYDFLTNVKDRTFPKGMSIEFIRTAFYKEKILWIESEEAYKEHVTFAFYDNPPAEMKVKFFYNEKFPKLSGSDLALDSPEDFKFIERMIEELGTKMKNYTLKEIEDAYVKLER